MKWFKQWKQRKAAKREREAHFQRLGKETFELAEALGFPLDVKDAYCYGFITQHLIFPLFQRWMTLKKQEGFDR